MKEGEGMLMHDKYDCPLCGLPLVASPTSSIWTIKVSCTGKCDFTEKRSVSDGRLVSHFDKQDSGNKKA